MFRPADEREGWPIRRLAALLLVALAVRVALSLALPQNLGALPDQIEYLDLAKSLLAGDGFVVVDARYATDQTLYAQRTPGYPLFVAACGANVTVVRLAQAVLDALTVLATVVLARRWLGNGASLVAGAFVALNPFLIYFGTLVLSETLYTALLAWGIVGVARVGGRGGKWWWAGMFVLALSVHVRPSGLGLAVVLGLASAFLPGRHPFALRSRWPLPAGLTSLAICGLVLLPWAMRNKIVLGEFVWTTTNNGITLYDGWNLDNVTGGSDQSFVGRMPQLALMNEVDRSTYLKDKAVADVRERPGRAAVLALKKLARTWSPVPLSEDRPFYRAVGLAYCVPMFLLAAVGLLGGLPRSAKALLLAPAVYFSVIHMLSVGSLRYRLPGDPQLAVLAAAGLSGLWAALRARRAEEEAEVGEPEPGR